jgi:hypothetical protein
MKKIFLLLLGGSVSAFAIFFVLKDPGWECGVRYTIGDMHRKGNSLSMSNVSIGTFGFMMLIETKMSSLGPTAQYNIRGDGKYSFRYSDNVKKIGLWSGQTKVYEGPPIAAFNVGTGWIGIDIHAEGSTHVEATNRCSIRSLLSN